jgi:glycerophosphoryl diester phosphodiesterase
VSGVPGLIRPAHLPALKRVGHKGADHVAPGNTTASFEAALECGVDMIEFDVLPMGDGTLVLAHDFGDASRRDPLTLEEGLDHFAGDAYGGVELDVDLKLPGYERAVLDELADRGLDGRALISSTYPRSLELIGELAPETRRGWSFPRAQRDYTESALFKLPAYAVLQYWRLRLPGWAAVALRRGTCEALMAHNLAVTQRLVDVVHDEGGELYVWTVDDAARIARLEAMGADGVITNDPRLFDSAAT